MAKDQATCECMTFHLTEEKQVELMIRHRAKADALKIYELNKKELQKALMDSLHTITMAEHQEGQLVGFIIAIGCGDIFMKTQKGEGINLAELKQTINGIQCPCCADAACSHNENN